MSFSSAAVITLFAVAAGGIAISQELSHADIAAAAGSQVVALEDGSLTLRATRPLRAGSSHFGIEGGTNNFAIDDADGAAPADEVLEMELGSGHGLTGIDFIWTRGVLSVSGFSSDPVADRGSYDGSGTWSLFQPWTGSASSSVRFANPGASAGLLLQFSILDPSQANPQAALQRLLIRPLDSPNAVITVDPSTTHQTLDHFGASMFWTIDPTAGWPESTREELALMLVSEASGLGLSNLRFDFGGGSNGPGSTAAEPRSWRFPEALKDGPDAPFDWSRRAGQQWFLKRADQLGIGTLTLGAVSPPWWMTRNGLTRCDPAVGSTNLDPTKVDDFASYLAEVLEHFRDREGITFDEVSPFNEPEWSWNSSSQEGCRFTAADARPLVSALHQALVDRSLDGDTAILLGEHGIISSMLDDTRHESYAGSIWNGGHNSSGDGKYREYLKDLHSHPDLSEKTSGAAAYHSYWTDDLTTLNGPVRDLLRQNADEDGLELVQTEYAILGAEGPGRNLQFGPALRVARVIHRDLTRADAIGWSWWLALSPHDYKDGLIYTDADNASVSQPRLFRSRIAAALGHYSRFIRPGWQRLDTPGTDDLAGIFASAWRSPDHREIAIVAANASHFPKVVQLPDNSLGDFGAVQEWEVWITDRGRHLELAVISGRHFELPAHSFATFIGRPRQSMFRLGASIHASSAQATAGQQIVVTATSHWENGVVVCPALSATQEWVLAPIDAAPVGHPQAGRHYLRCHANGDYLHFIEGERQTLPSAGPSAVWDLDKSGPDSLTITHHDTGLGMGPDGRLTPRLAAPLSYQLSLLTPSFQWADGLGSANTATLTTEVPRTVSARAFHPDASASARLRLPVGQEIPTLTLTPSATTIRRGESVTLRAEIHGGEAWTFRLIPSDRDAAIRAAADGTLSMSEPDGDDGERWELVEPDGSRIWAMPHNGRPCRIRSSTHGGFLQPDGAPLANAPLKTGEPGGTESLWTIQPADDTGFRIEHPDSGLVLSLSSSTGLPILGADEGRRSERFHFDSMASPPARIQWSHGLGSGSEIIVSPLHSTTYVVDAEIDGFRFQSRVAVIVTRAFDEWMSDWFGGAVPENDDGDGDGVPLLLEYAHGSDPLRADAAEWQELDLQSRSLSWTRNPEALGTWTVETSTNLQTWEPTTFPVDPSPDHLTVKLPEILPERSFFRMKFNPESF